MVLKRFWNGFRLKLVDLFTFSAGRSTTLLQHFTTNEQEHQRKRKPTRTKNFLTPMRAAKNLSQTYNGSRETYNPGLLQHSNLLVPFSRLLLPATPAQLLQHNYYYQLLLLPHYQLLLLPLPLNSTYPLLLLLPYPP